jgi:predicted O-linked N-acetylglucosamine transferase (SPINDLY family)
VRERTLVSNHLSTPVTAQQTYDDEIARLRTVVNRRRPQLDSATVVVIEHNLKVIDDAIAQCKQALKKDPASRFLMESLNDAMDNKVQLLRTAAVLPTKM